MAPVVVSRRAVLALVLSAQILSVARAAEDAGKSPPVKPLSCAKPVDRATFSPRGTQVVAGFIGQHLYLHTQLPEACANRSDDGCRGTAYVVSGDAVVVGEVCGGWTAVKFHSTTRDYYGWVQTNRLAKLNSEYARFTPEEISYIAVDARLCEGALYGEPLVGDVALQEITPISLDAEAFGAIVDDIEGARVFELLRRGSVDIDNDGQTETVAIARSWGSPLGPGTKNHVWEWPVVLNEKGVPDVHADLNKHAAKAGNEMARLIGYQGRIYLESRSFMRQPYSHGISEISAKGIRTMCSFKAESRQFPVSFRGVGSITIGASVEYLTRTTHARFTVQGDRTIGEEDLPTADCAYVSVWDDDEHQYEPGNALIREGSVERVDVIGRPRYSTEEGIHVGSPEGEVRRGFEGRFREGNIKVIGVDDPVGRAFLIESPQKGAAMLIESNGTVVTAIHVGRDTSFQIEKDGAIGAPRWCN